MLYGRFASKWNVREISIMSIFMISLVISMAICIVNKRGLLLQSDMLSLESLSLVKIKNYSKGDLFLYIIQKRMWIIPIVYILSTTYLATPTVYGIVSWYGLSLGGILSLCLLRYGIKGFFFLILCGFPQYLFYLPALLIAFRLSLVKREIEKRFILQLLVLEMVVFVGCFMEAYANAWILPKLVKIFVGL